MHHHHSASRGGKIAFSAFQSRVTEEYRRMRANFATIVAADHRIDCMGVDPFVKQLISSHGLDQRQAFTARLLIKGETGRCHRVTAIIVAARLCHNDADRITLREITMQAAEERTRCLLVPQHSLLVPRRLGSAHLLASSRDITCTQSERLAVLEHAAEHGWSTLGDCSSVLQGHADPVGAVLGLVARGALRIDRNRRLGPHSRIDVAA